MNTYDEESLRKMSYSALKKHAKEKGIKVNMKADNLIALILEQTNKDEDSFVTLERSIINSCKKNKENLFDKDKEVPSETPRRDTYTVTSPLKNIELLNDSLVMVSASPELKKPIRDESLNITLSRGSEKKSQRSRKVSFVTPLRKSSRISSATPQFNSVKDRPKTPMPTRLSSSKKHVSFKNQDNDSVVGCLNLDVSECNDSTNLCNKKVRRPSTPMPLSRRRSTRLSSAAVREELCTSPDFKSTPKPNLILQQLEEAQEPSTNKDEAVVTPLPSPLSSKKFKPLAKDKTDITPLASSSSKKAKALVNENKTDVTPLTLSSSSKKAKALANEGSKVATPLTSSLSSKKAKALANDDNTDAKPLKSSFSSKKSKELVSKPTEKKAVLSEPHSVKKTVATTFSKRKQLTPMHASLSSQRTSPRFGVKTPVPSGLSLSSKKTPNFNKLHQHQFDKMESIDDYQKRKAQNSAKKHKEQLKYHYPIKSNNLKKTGAENIKKSPNAFPGVPFIPSTKTINFGKSLRLKAKSTTETTKPVSKNDSTLAKKLAVADTVKKVKSVTRENTPLKQRHKFDLKASLAKKLPYKPHSGPIKPLSEVNLNNTIQVAPSALVKKKENENVVIKAARAESREVLRGVRKNKRFLLQMNNRKLNMSMQ